MENETQSTPSFLSRLGRAVIVILRVVFFLAILAILGWLVYFGTPYIYENVLLPIENNTARIEELESQQRTELEQLDDQLSGIQGQVEALEAELEGAISAHDETLGNLDEIEASLDSLLETSKEQEQLLVLNDTAIADVRRQVNLSRSIELLTRAQLYLSQNNFGLAKSDIENARDILLSLQTEMPTERAEALEVVIDHLSFALENLPKYPIIALDGVNIAWQLLVNDLPDLPELPLVEETETPVPEPTPTETP